jgi:transposase
MDLTDDQWAIVTPLFPLPSPHLRGRPPLDERAILDAVFWKLSRSAAWYDLPDRYPSHQTCYRRYCEWRRLGLLDKLIAELLYDLKERAGLHPLQAYCDGYVTLARTTGTRWDVTLTPDFPVPWGRRLVKYYFWEFLRAICRRGVI